MKLLTFVENGAYRLGIKTEQGIVDVTAAKTARDDDSQTIPGTVHEAIEGGAAAQATLQQLADWALTEAARGETAYLKNETSLQLAPCVPRPGKIICVGTNYRKLTSCTGSWSGKKLRNSARHAT